MKTAIAILLLASFGTMAQEAKAPEYVPNPAQMQRLLHTRDNIIYLGAQMQQAQAAYNNAVQASKDEGEKIRVENNWPPTVTFDYQTDTYTPAKPETKK